MTLRLDTNPIHDLVHDLLCLSSDCVFANIIMLVPVMSEEIPPNTSVLTYRLFVCHSLCLQTSQTFPHTLLGWKWATHTQGMQSKARTSIGQPIVVFLKLIKF